MEGTKYLQYLHACRDICRNKIFKNTRYTKFHTYAGATTAKILVDYYKPWIFCHKWPIPSYRFCPALDRLTSSCIWFCNNANVRVQARIYWSWSDTFWTPFRLISLTFMEEAFLLCLEPSIVLVLPIPFHYFEKKCSANSVSNWLVQGAVDLNLSFSNFWT